MHDDTGGGPGRAAIIAALVVAVAAIGAVLAIAATRRTPAAPIAIAGVPAPQAESAECRALMATLPERLGEFTRAAAAEPVPPGAAAWRGSGEHDAGDPVILRCGLDRPAEFVVGTPLQMVDDVQWLRLADGSGNRPDSERSTWVSVDRPVYIALTLPAGSGPAPIQTLSEVIARTMPAMPIRPAPAR